MQIKELNYLLIIKVAKQIKTGGNVKTMDKDEHKVKFYNPNNIVIAKYKKYDQEEFDLFVMSKFYILAMVN